MELNIQYVLKILQERKISLEKCAELIGGASADEVGNLIKTFEGIRDNVIPLDPPVARRFATLSWLTGDVTDQTDMTDAEATDWLADNEKSLRGALAETGNEIIREFLERDNLIVDED